MSRDSLVKRAGIAQMFINYSIIVYIESNY